MQLKWMGSPKSLAEIIRDKLDNQLSSATNISFYIETFTIQHNMNRAAAHIEDGLKKRDFSKLSSREFEEYVRKLTNEALVGKTVEDVTLNELEARTNQEELINLVMNYELPN